MKRNGYSLIQVVIIIIATAIISAMATGVIITKGNVSSSGMSYSDLLKDEQIKEFLDVYGQVSEDYYKKVDKENMIDSAIDGMLSYLNETYTTYLDDEATSQLVEQLDGTYQGIGVIIKDRQVMNVVKDSPANKSGILPGDEIVKINDEDVTQKSSNEIVQMIKSFSGSISLEIKRGSEYRTFALETSTLKVPNSQYYMIDNTKVGYIAINVFGKNLSKEIEYAIDYLEGLEMESLIIDLRNNNGGYLEEANNTASLFLEKGKTIYYLKDKTKQTEFKDKSKKSQKCNIVVLINGKTASAAEILTAALKESYGATLVGQTTFGKGKVQHTYTRTNGTLVKYTSSNWLTPNQTCIDGKGIKPDYEVENEYLIDEESQEMSIIAVDKQFDKALELLSK